MRKNKILLLASILFLGLFSCQDEKDLLVEQPKQDAEFHLSRHRFASVDEMYAAMSEISQRKRSKVGRRTKSNWIKPVDKEDTVPSLEIPITDIDGDFMGDGVIKYEYTNISKERLIEGNNLTYYEACGYDTLVPDTTFARVLNIKGEVQVGDTVYKISPKGTYHFHASLEPYFSENYAKFEETDGSQISDKTYLIDKAGIYRYDTFAKDPDENSEAENMPDDIAESDIEYTPLINKSFASEVNWTTLPTYNADAKTIAGKIWQKLFGSNKSYYNQIAKKRRVRGKLYFYKYLIYEEIGATVELQKKNWIGWSGTKTDKLTINWHNIVLEYKYPKKPKDIPTNKPIYCNINNNQQIPSLDKKGKVTSIFGLELSKELFDKICAKGGQTIFNILKSKLGDKLPASAADSQAFTLYTDDRFYVFIPDGYIDDVNTSKRHKIFHNKWKFIINFNLLKMSPDWQTFAHDLMDLNADSPTLAHGQVRVGACLSGKWGGMTIYKIDENLRKKLK